MRETPFTSSIHRQYSLARLHYHNHTAAILYLSSFVGNLFDGAIRVSTECKTEVQNSCHEPVVTISS